MGPEKHKDKVARGKALKSLLQSLYLAARAGGEVERGKLAEAAMPIVNSVAARLGKGPDARYLNVNGNSDLVSVGLLALMWAVDDALILKVERGNIGGYFRRAIANKVRDAILDDAQASPDSCTQFKRIARGEDDGVLAKHETEAADTWGGNLRNGQPSLTHSDLARRANNDLSAIDCEEKLAACCETRFERTVITLRKSGWTDAEIGKKTGKAPSHIAHVRARVRKRYYCEGVELTEVMSLADIANRCQTSQAEAKRLPQIINLKRYAKA